MALTPSRMIELGTPAPDFRLLDALTNRWVCRDQVAGPRGLLVMFICNHCPYVRHVEAALIKLGRDYRNSGVGIVAINANDVDAYPEDHPRLMAQKAYPFPYLYDETQAVARAYGAACTPDFFLFDRALGCIYRGQLDASRPGSEVPVSGRDLRRAIEALLAGEPVDSEQQPSVGCNIKWRSPESQT